MDEAGFARAQMGISLAFHIVFAAIGVAMPLLMVLAEWRGRRQSDGEYLELARRWAKGTAVLFAVGAVSGTVLSFELGLLFPEFMRQTGAIVGLPFALEGFAFFTEAIFLGVYLYGWERVSARAHLFAGVVVALSGLASAVFVTFVNAWMNAPTGFVAVGTKLAGVDALAAFRSPFAAHEIVHGTLAVYAATGFGVAGVHAWALLRAPARASLHEKALGLALVLAVPAALLLPLAGHFAGQQVARHQPAKLAAIEGLERTQAAAPLRLGPIEIPGGLSFLATGDAGAVVQGLDAFPPADRPPRVVRACFQVMVLAGGLLAAVALWAGLARLRGGWPRGRAFRRALVASAPLGFLALEAGWLVTELGRQPWVVYGVLRTEATVTPMPGLAVPCAVFTLVYLGLSAAVVAILRWQVRATLAGPMEDGA